VHCCLACVVLSETQHLDWDLAFPQLPTFVGHAHCSGYEGELDLDAVLEGRGSGAGGRGRGRGAGAGGPLPDWNT
jgi:hypothetical protein